MIESLERLQQKARAIPFVIKRDHDGYWYVWEDEGCGNWVRPVRCTTQRHAQAFVLGMLDFPELNWPSRVR